MVAQTNTEAVGLAPRVRANEVQIARLQGGQEHLATKADIEMLIARIEKLRADLTWRILLAMGLVMAFIEWRVVGG